MDVVALAGATANRSVVASAKDALENRLFILFPFGGFRRRSPWMPSRPLSGALAAESIARSSAGRTRRSNAMSSFGIFTASRTSARSRSGSSSPRASPNGATSCSNAAEPRARVKPKAARLAQERLSRDDDARRRFLVGHAHGPL